MKPKIKYVPKNKLYPAFGEAKNNTAYVRKDLPYPVKEYVLDHELYHIRDNARNWIWREIKASAYGTVKHPFGALICLIMTLQPHRVKFYIQRVKKGK